MNCSPRLPTPTNDNFKHQNIKWVFPIFWPPQHTCSYEAWYCRLKHVLQLGKWHSVYGIGLWCMYTVIPIPWHHVRTLRCCTPSPWASGCGESSVAISGSPQWAKGDRYDQHQCRSWSLVHECHESWTPTYVHAHIHQFRDLTGLDSINTVQPLLASYFW